MPFYPSAIALARLVRIGALAVALLLLSPLLHADALDNIYARKKLLVGTGLVVPPYNMLDNRLQPTGSDVELARMLARDMGVELEFVRIVNATGVEFLLAHKADVVMSTFSVTSDRLQLVDFSIPYGSIASVLGGPRGMRVSSLGDLAGQTVAVLRGSTSEKQMSDAAPAVDLVRYDSNNDLVSVMVNGQQQFVATAPAMLDEMNRQRGANFMESKLLLQVSPYAIGLRKDGGKLKSYLDAWVARNLANGRINAIYKRFHGQDLPADVLQMRTVVR